MRLLGGGAYLVPLPPACQRTGPRPSRRGSSRRLRKDGQLVAVHPGACELVLPARDHRRRVRPVWHQAHARPHLLGDLGLGLIFTGAWPRVSVPTPVPAHQPTGTHAPHTPDSTSGCPSHRIADRLLIMQMQSTPHHARFRLARPTPTRVSTVTAARRTPAAPRPRPRMPPTAWTLRCSPTCGTRI